MKSKKVLKVVVGTISAPGLYHMGDVYVYPLRLEGVGLTLAEALSCGMPVITTDQQPMNEFAPPSCSKVVEVKRMCFRDDGYYWPMCEIDIHDLVINMRMYFEKLDKLNDYKEKARAYAESNLDWVNNYPYINKIFEHCTFKTIDKELIRALRSEDDDKFPFISRLPKVYEMIFRLYYLLRGMGN